MLHAWSADHTMSQNIYVGCPRSPRSSSKSHMGPHTSHLTFFFFFKLKAKQKAKQKLKVSRNKGPGNRGDGTGGGGHQERSVAALSRDARAVGATDGRWRRPGRRRADQGERPHAHTCTCQRAGAADSNCVGAAVPATDPDRPIDC